MVPQTAGVIWWIRHIFFAAASGFFLLFGVQLLITAYRLDNPFFFVMTFFSSNLIILISAAVLFGFICRMIASRRDPPQDKEDPVQ